jgi:hypothetical protein
VAADSRLRTSDLFLLVRRKMLLRDGGVAECHPATLDDPLGTGFSYSAFDGRGSGGVAYVFQGSGKRRERPCDEAGPDPAAARRRKRGRITAMATRREEPGTGPAERAAAVSSPSSLACQDEADQAWIDGVLTADPSCCAYDEFV